MDIVGPIIRLDVGLVHSFLNVQLDVQKVNKFEVCLYGDGEVVALESLTDGKYHSSENEPQFFFDG